MKIQIFLDIKGGNLVLQKLKGVNINILIIILRYSIHFSHSVREDQLNKETRKGVLIFMPTLVLPGILFVNF